MTRDHALRLAASRMYLMREDVELIQQCVIELMALRNGNPLTVVDLGAGSGTTALAVLDVADDVEIATIDINEQNLAWAELAVRNAYPHARWASVHLDAAEAASRWTLDGWVDLLLHDASHEQDAVERDIRAWLPLLAPDALVWVHDYAPPPQSWGQPDSPGVALAIGALCNAGLLRRVRVGGLGWVGSVHA